MKITTLTILFLLGFFAAQSQVWQPDLGDGTYKNPVIFADYSDPDVVRVGDDFYLVSSSFNCAPALPVLHSKDLVNWQIINNVFLHQPPEDHFSKPQHGNGVWAPSIRYHDSWFYIFYGDPDFGIYMCKTQDPAGAWEGPHLVHGAKGWIDACPFWDEDGKAYLVHAFAGSRAGIKSILVLHPMASDGSKLLDEQGVLVFDGQKGHGTIEGPKMYKRHGYYYIFAPAGGVATGWQTVLRAKNIYGPYEEKIVLDQGKTAVNGPHQGAWVNMPDGSDWFLHFQERQPYGRIVHLQPAVWKNDWIVIGNDPDGDGKGEPVMTGKKPGPGPAFVPQTSDEFNETRLGLQWQWHANPASEWAFNTPYGYLRMYPVVLPEYHRNFWNLPNLLLQKMPAPVFTATTKLNFSAHADGEKTGLLVMGLDYAYLSIEQDGGRLYLVQAKCVDADKGKEEQTLARIPIDKSELQLRVQVAEGGMCRFSYSLDGKQFTPVGEPFQAREGKWIGAKVGLFCTRVTRQNDGGYADYDWFRISN